MNEFTYIVGATVEVQRGLAIWIEKIREYLDTYYQSDKENAKNTKFYRCMSKTEIISDDIFEKEQFIRGVIDDQNLLASICIVQETGLLLNNNYTRCLEIESLTNSPWNTIKYPLQEKRKGAATSLIEGIIKEARSKEFSDILKLITVPDEKEFYQSIGFEETNGSGEMVLTSNAASMLLLDLEQKRNSTNFD
ncbi:MAG: GNAT family N-acetyltransferase [Cyanobacteriota bacterium]|nr:GNAT family N-acetyltransferase [Cyanobacteriota bacterium]